MARIGEIIGPNNEVLHPQTSSDLVYLEDGRNVEQVLSDNIDYGNVVFQDNTYHLESDVENDFAKTMIFKGQTYQNILPEPSTHVLTNNKEMFKVNEGLDPNVEIVDAVSKSAILSGSTKYQIGEFIQDVYAPVQQFKTGYYLGPDDGTLIQGGNEHKYCEDYIPLPTGVTSITSKGSNNWKKLCCYDSNKNFISGANGTAGLEDLTLNIPSNAKYFRYSTNTAKGENEYINVVSNTGLLLASSNYNIPCELISCKMPVLKTTGKNLFNYSDLVAGEVVWNTSNNVNIFEDEWYRERADGVGFGLRKCIKVKPNTRYYANFPQSIHFMQYKANGDLIKGNYPMISTGYVTTSSETHYVNLFPSGGIGSAWNEARRQEYQNCYISESEAMSSYEPYKTNILTVNDDVILRGVGDVKDTLDLMTGELTERIGEVVLDGSEGWILSTSKDNTQVFNLAATNSKLKKVKRNGLIMCDKLKVAPGVDDEIISLTSTLYIALLKSKVSTVEELKVYLSQNPITFIHELVEESIKTVDLSSSGNWEKVVLDGSEDWTKEAFASGIVRWRASLPNTIGNAPCCCDKLPVYPTSDKRDMDYVRCSTNLVWVYQKDTSLTLEQFRAKLQSDPLTVWYQVNTHKESTQVKQPIFFADGHVIQSSQNKKLLLPTLKYRAKTSNSYVLNLMRPDTTYTIKAGTASGTATLNGIEAFSLETNRTFLSPSEEAMGNRLLIINGNVSNLMILEGDLTNQELPYFEGIQSAFESNEVKITTTGKNLFDAYKYPFDTTSAQTLRVEVLSSNAIRTYCNEPIAWRSAFVTYQLEPNSWYKVQCQAEGNGVKAIEINVFEMGNNWNPDVTQCNESSNMIGTFRTQDSGLVKLTFQGSGNQSATFDNTYTNIQIEKVESKNSEATAYEPYRSSVTKLQLPDALRSLPNGRHDELIIKRDQKKATLIQRVGYGILDGKQGFATAVSPIDSQLYQPFYCYDVFGNAAVVNKGVNIWCDKFEVNGTAKAYFDFTRNIFYQYTDYSARFAGMIMKEDLCGKHVNKWFEANPTTVFYTLASPVITEIDLEGYPYLCRDGHIFLTSEIAPTVGIEYSINQGHRLMGQVETVRRHDKQFSQLERYFADLVYSDYNLTLLRLNECLIEEEGVFDEESTVND